MTRSLLSKATRAELRQWMNWLWPDDPATRLQDRAERLRQALRKRLDLLVQLRSMMEGLRQRLSQEEKRIARLSPWVGQSYRTGDQTSAWDRALTLDEARQRVAVGRAQLQLLEEAYHQRLVEFDEIKRRLADLPARIRLAQLQQA